MQVDAVTAASHNVIVITPVGDTRAAVAYQVVKV
jgi:hypothetical protein